MVKHSIRVCMYVLLAHIHIYIVVVIKKNNKSLVGYVTLVHSCHLVKPWKISPGRLPLCTALALSLSFFYFILFFSFYYYFTSSSWLPMPEGKDEPGNFIFPEEKKKSCLTFFIFLKDMFILFFFHFTFLMKESLRFGFSGH